MSKTAVNAESKRVILISDSATYLYCKDGDFEATTMEDGTHRFTLKYQVGKNEKLTLTLNEAVVRRFGLEFKSKVLPYGAERLRTDDAYNLGICSRADCGRDGFPRIPKASAKPNELQGFNYAKSTPSDQKRGKGCHFFIDDYQVRAALELPERVPWRSARLRLRARARFQPVYGHARPDAAV